MRLMRKGRQVPLVSQRRLPEFLWDYQPIGPTFTIESVVNGIGEAAEFDSLDETIQAFAEQALPIWPYCHWQVLDEKRVVILGYSATVEATESFGPWGWWAGVEAAFEILARVHDPMEAAVWETMAREHPNG